MPNKKASKKKVSKKSKIKKIIKRPKKAKALDGIDVKEFKGGVAAFVQPKPGYIPPNGITPEVETLMKEAQRLGGGGFVVLKTGGGSAEETENSILRQVAEMVDKSYGCNISKKVDAFINSSVAK